MVDWKVGLAVSIAWAVAASAESADAPRSDVPKGKAADTPRVSAIPVGIATGRPSWQGTVPDAYRPTAWQLQNPSGIDNRSPTSADIPGYVAPNSYFGPQYREWSGMSPPVSQIQRPANMTPTTPLIQTNVPMGPLNYWGPASARWSNVTVPRPQPDPLGGWNIPSGW